MATYRVERMTNSDYNIYMSGGYDYKMENILVEAETVEEAIQKATKSGMVINKGYIKTLEEIKAEKEAKAKAEAERKAKAEKAKAKRKETELRKATEMGLTVEEYRKAKAHKATVTRVTKEIKELEKVLEQKRKYLAELTKRG